jgi:hypothetical protein
MIAPTKRSNDPLAESATDAEDEIKDSHPAPFYYVAS